MSSSNHSNPSSSSSELDRDLAFYSGLTFVLEPKQKSRAPSEHSLQSVTTKLDQNATTTKDPRSKNYWLRATDSIAAVKIRRLLKKNSDFGDFTVREIRPGSAEETRIRLHITKWLASATIQPPSPDLDESQPSTPDDADPQEDDISKSVGKRRRSHRLAGPRQDVPAPPHTSAPNEPSVAGPSREKRKATHVFSDRDEAPAGGLGSAAFPELSILERPQKRVKFDLDLNTFKYFEEWDDLEPLPSSSNTRRALTTAPTVKDLPATCLRSIFIYGTPDPTITLAKTYRSTLYGLMAVCTKWKNVAESTPSLWSHLSNANPPGMLDACIQRSSGVSITVHFDGSMEYPSTVQSALDKFVDKVTPYRLRWRSLRFNDVPPTWRSYLAIARAFSGPAPALKSAEVTTIHGTTMPFVHSLRCFSGDAGTLRHIALTGIVPKLGDLPIFANVETLRVIRPMGICPAYLLRILARNDKLRYLELVDVRPSYARLFQNIETLELPELLQFKLHLVGENTVEMAQLFTRLRAPKCRQLDLAIDMDNLEALNLAFNDLEFDLEAFLVILGTWMSKWIVLNSTRSVYRWVDPTPTGISNKPVLHWQYGGAVDGTYRGLSADVRLGVESRRTKTIILQWVEDVKLHAGLVEAAVKRGVRSGQMESFQSYRQRLVTWRRESEGVEDDINPTNLWPA